MLSDSHFQQEQFNISKIYPEFQQPICPLRFQYYCMNTSQDSPLTKASSLCMRRKSSLSSQNPSVLALRHSISKGVKYGDISLINKKPSQRGQDQVIPDIAAEKTEGAFDSIRKKHDKMRKQRIDKERSVEKLKEQVQKSKEEERAYVEKKNQATEVSGNLERKMADVKEAYEMNRMEQAVFTHMRQRLRFSNQFQKNKSLGLEIQKRQLKRMLSDSNSIDVNLDAESTKTRTLLEILRYQFGKETQERQNHLETLRQKIEQIRKTNFQFEERDNEIRQIAEKAIQDKDQNEKWWRRALLTNKLVSKFLQNKMHIEMEKFNVVETAFKNIKIATGVLDGPTMVTRYIEKEKIYGRLLDSIAKSEKEIDKLNQNKEELLKEKKELEAEIAQSDANLNKGAQNLNNQYHQLTNISQKNAKSDVCNYKLSQWLSKQHRKISGNANQIKPNTYSPSQLKEGMSKLLSWLSQQYDQYIQNGSQAVEINFEVDSKKISQQETGSDSDIKQDQIQEQEQFVDNQRKQFLKENRKQYEKLKKQRREKEMLLLQQESKMKFTKLDKLEGVQKQPVKQKEEEPQKVEKAPAQ